MTNEEKMKKVRTMDSFHKMKTELLAVPGAGGIIERTYNGVEYILIQERCKKDAEAENGLIEIPAGKIREYENIFDCLRREIKEETGLDVAEIEGETESYMCEVNGYRVLNYSPFICAQNIAGHYPVLVQVFVCKARGELLKGTNESQNLRWISLHDLQVLLKENTNNFYPMHIHTLQKYLKRKGGVI